MKQTPQAAMALADSRMKARIDRESRDNGAFRPLFFRMAEYNTLARIEKRGLVRWDDNLSGYVPAQP